MKTDISAIKALMTTEQVDHFSTQVKEVIQPICQEFFNHTRVKIDTIGIMPVVHMEDDQETETITMMRYMLVISMYDIPGKLNASDVNHALSYLALQIMEAIMPDTIHTEPMVKGINTNLVVVFNIPL